MLFAEGCGHEHSQRVGISFVWSRDEPAAAAAARVVSIHGDRRHQRTGALAPTHGRGANAARRCAGTLADCTACADPRVGAWAFTLDCSAGSGKNRGDIAATRSVGSRARIGRSRSAGLTRRYRQSTDELIAAIVGQPQWAIAISSSRRRMLTVRVTPRAPSTARP